MHNISIRNKRMQVEKVVDRENGTYLSGRSIPAEKSVFSRATRGRALLAPEKYSAPCRGILL